MNLMGGLVALICPILLILVLILTSESYTITECYQLTSESYTITECYQNGWCIESNFLCKDELEESGLDSVPIRYFRCWNITYDKTFLGVHQRSYMYSHDYWEEGEPL